MSDNLANKKVEETVKPQAKAGDVDTTSPLAKLLHAQNETHNRLLEPFQKPAAPHAASEVAAVVHPTVPTLPAFHLIEKPAAPSVPRTAPSEQHQTLYGKLIDWRGTLQSAKEAYTDLTSRKHSTTEKLMLAGTALVGVAAFVAPEFKGLRGVAGELRGAGGELRATEEIARGATNEGKVGLASLQALKTPKAAAVAEHSINSLANGEKAVIKTGTFESVGETSGNAEAASLFTRRPAAGEAPRPAANVEAPRPAKTGETSKPGITPVAQPERKIVSNGATLRAEAEHNPTNFAPDHHLGPQNEFRTETAPVPKITPVKAPEPHPITVDARVRANDVPVVTDVPVVAKVHARPAAHEDLTEAPSTRVREADVAKAEPAKSVKNAEIQATPSGKQIDSPLSDKPLSVTPVAQDQVVAKTIKPVHVEEKVQIPAPAETKPLHESPVHVEPKIEAAAPSEPQLLRDRPASPGQTSELAKPATVVPHPSTIEVGTKESLVAERNLNTPALRSDLPHSTEALRTESTIAETQIVSHSNALAENVHKLELPANAAPEVLAAKARLQEGSLLLSQSSEKVKVLQNMQSDLKVLEKSVPSEALADIRKSVAAMQAPAETMERTAIGAAEKQVVHARPTESTSPSVSDAQTANRNVIEPKNEIRSTENVEKPAVASPKPAQTSVPSVNAVASQAPHAASVQEQSLKLLESSELSKPGREAASRIIQDTNDWGAKTLTQRNEIVERLEKNLSTLRTEPSAGKEFSSMTKSVETLKLGTRAESAAVKADADIGNLTSRVNPQVAENAEFKAAQTRLRENTEDFGTVRSKTSIIDLRSDIEKMERVAGTEAVAPIRQRITDLEKAVVERDAALPVASEKPAFSTSPLSEVQATSRPAASEAVRSQAALESHVPGVVSKQELNAASEQLRGNTNKLQEDALAVLEKGGLKAESRKALVDVVQDSGNLARLEGPARAKALGRIEQNLKIAAQDERVAAEAGSLRKTFDSVEITAAKAERLEQFDRTSAQTLPKINEEVAGIKKSHFANPETAEKAGVQLKAIEEDAASLAKASDKGAALTRMQGNVDRLEESLGKDAVAPLKENVDRLEFSHRNSARAHAIEETTATAQASRESLSTEMRDLAREDAKLSPAAKSAAQDVEKLTAGSQRLSDGEVTRLRENVATISRDAEPAVAARLHGHVHNIETGNELTRLDKTLTNVTEDTVAANRQAALAASKTQEPSVVALHQATESLRLNGVSELSAARLAYEKAVPALSREDAINIDRSLSRIETHTGEVSALKQKLADMQNAHVAAVEQNPHFYSQNEAQKARDIHQLVTSHRDGVVAEALERAASMRNTSELSVFTKPANSPVTPDNNVIGLTSRTAHWFKIGDTAEKIRDAAREGVLGLQRHPIAAGVAGTIGIGSVSFMPTLAAAQTYAYNARQSNFAPLDFSPKAHPPLNASPSDTTIARNGSVIAAPANLDQANRQQTAKAEATAKPDAIVKSDATAKSDVTVKPEVANRPDATVRTETVVKIEAPAVKADPVVRGALNADIASLTPTMQALKRTSDGGVDPTNGSVMKFGDSLIYKSMYSGVIQEAEARAAIIQSKVFKASTVTVGQPDSADDRSRIFYPPFISPLAVSARVRKPQSLLGIEPVRVGTATGFLTANLSPTTTSLSNPLNFTREKADGGAEDRGNAGAGAIGNGLNLAAASAATASTALLNAVAPDPNGQAVTPAVASES